MLRRSVLSVAYCALHILCITFLIPTGNSSGTPVVGRFTEDDRLKLEKFFLHQLKESSTEQTKVFYALKGLTTLNSKVPSSKTLCNALTFAANTPESAYFHAVGLNMLGATDCKIMVKEIESLASKKLTGTPQIEDLFYTVMSLKEIGSKVDKTEVLKHINRIKSKDSSPPTMGLIFQLVSALNLSKSELSSYTAMIPTVFGQADELNGKLIYFDRGLYTTALVAQGVSDLLTATKDTKVVSESQLVKLINFIYKRLHSPNLRAAAYLTSALKALATNPYLAPVVIESHMGPAHAGEVHPGQTNLRLHLTDLWGAVTYSPDVLSLQAAGLYALQGPTANRVLTGPAERGAFSTADKTVYQLSLSSSNGSSPLPMKGRYELELTGAWVKPKQDRLLLGASQVLLPVHVSTEAKVVDPTLTIVDGTNDRHVADIRLTPGQLYKASSSTGALDLELGFQLTLMLRLVDTTHSSIPLTAHQVFVQLTHHQTEQAITFVLNEVAAIGVADAKAYKLHLDPENSAADFDYLDGIYKMELIVGDFYLRKPILWHMANVNLHFVGIPGSDSAERFAQATDVSRQRAPSAAALKRAPGPNPLIGTGPTQRRPEIEHMFRPPEKRAPPALALTFTAACAVPFVMLLIMWATLGINVWNFRFRLSNILFHSGLIAIFALYLTYWCCLDMFTTLRYLAILGVPTFLAGNCVLRGRISCRLAPSTSAKH